MKAMRVRSPEVLDMIKDNLVKTRTEWYKIQMEERPDSICIIIVIDGDDIIGHVAARLVENYVEGIKYAWVDSLYQETNNINAITVLIESKDVLFNWCKSLGLTQIRGEIGIESPLYKKGIYGTKEIAKIYVQEVE